jgi:hypothetical protein
MANSFFERKKEKRSSGLALFLGWKRGLGPLILLLALVMGLFIAPAGVFTAVSSAIARLTGRRQDQSYSDIVAQLRAARQQTNKTAWSLFSRGGAGSDADSLTLVRGGEHDVLGAASIASKIQGGKTIHGVLSPEDSRKRGQGVELATEDLQGGFVATAAAGVFPGANLLTGGRVAPATPEAGASAAMRASLVPGAGKMVAGRQGKISKTEFRAVQANQAAFGGSAAKVGTPGSALYVLADAQVRGRISSAPVCSKDNGCPTEYAHTNTGAVYDGNATGKNGKGGSIISDAPPVRGVDGASTPGLVTFDGSFGNAAGSDDLERVKADQRACDMADAQFKPLLNPHVQRMTELGVMAQTPANAMEMKKECRIVNDLLKQQYDACPLRREDGPFEPQQCD